MASLQARQNTFVDPDTGEVFYTNGNSFWYTREGNIVRWSIFFGILILFLAYMVIGRMHAKKRINKGLKPLAYHRWLLNKQQRARYDPAYQNPSVYYQQYPPQQYGMQPYGGAPPPMYDPNAAMPPTYQPPVGATKVDPTQWRSEPTRRPAESGEAAPEYSAPPGPPPAARVEPTATGSSNNPYRL